MGICADRKIHCRLRSSRPTSYSAIGFGAKHNQALKFSMSGSLIPKTRSCESACDSRAARWNIPRTPNSESLVADPSIIPSNLCVGFCGDDVDDAPPLRFSEEAFPEGPFKPRSDHIAKFDMNSVCRPRATPSTTIAVLVESRFARPASSRRAARMPSRVGAVCRGKKLMVARLTQITVCRIIACLAELVAYGLHRNWRLSGSRAPLRSDDDFLHFRFCRSP